MSSPYYRCPIGCFLYVVFNGVSGPCRCLRVSKLQKRACENTKNTQDKDKSPPIESPGSFCATVDI